MVILLIVIADDVVVHDSVFAWTIVPWLFLRIVGSVLQPLQLVLEVEDVVGLLVTEGTILVLRQHFKLALLFDYLYLSFSGWVSEGLCDGVVLDFLALDKLSCNFLVWVSFTLEVLLSIVVSMHLLFPSIIPICKSYCSICICENVASRHFLYGLKLNKIYN